jgi:hypothetical protein
MLPTQGVIDQQQQQMAGMQRTISRLRNQLAQQQQGHQGDGLAMMTSASTEAGRCYLMRGIHVHAQLRWPLCA